MKTKTVRLTQEDIAYIVGLKPSALTQLKQGRRRGNIVTLEKFLDAAEKGRIDLDDIDKFFNGIVTRIFNLVVRGAKEF